MWSFPGGYFISWCLIPEHDFAGNNNDKDDDEDSDDEDNEEEEH